MRKIFAVICLFTFTAITYINVSAQDKGAIIVFSKTIHDFGKIVETDGEATCTFEFTNNGDKPLVISSVIPSCGCTTPGWTKEPVAPGAKGNIKATYNPLGRVAPFDKTLTVMTNGTPNRIILHIKGTVLPKPIDFNVSYPQNIGNLRLKQTSLSMGNLLSDASRTMTIETGNGSDAAVSFTFDKVPEHIKISAEPATLQPKQQGLIRVTVDASKKKDFGFTKDQIVVLSGNDKGTLEITTLIQPNLPKLEAKDANLTPRVLMKSKLFDFGTVNKGKTVTAAYELTNEGATDLIVYNITSDNPNVKSSVKSLKIKSGKTATLKLSYTTSQIGANEVKAYVATNDLANNLFEINIKGTVK